MFNEIYIYIYIYMRKTRYLKNAFIYIRIICQYKTFRLF